MSEPDFRPNFSLPDWGQTSPKARVRDEEDKENRRPGVDAKLVDTDGGKQSVATNSADLPGRKESVATKLGWSTTFTMDEDKRANLVFEALRRESVAAQQRKESMAIEASIEAQRRKNEAALSSPTSAASTKSRGPDQSPSSSEPGSPMRLDFGLSRDSGPLGRRQSRVDAVRRDSVRPERRPSYADTLFERGRLPGIADEDEQQPRRPGDRDEAGNKIQRQGVLSRILHWEMEAANAEDKNDRRKSTVSESSHDFHGRRKSTYSDAGARQGRRESGYASAGGQSERKRSEYERI